MCTQRRDLISVVQSRKSSKDKFKELLNRVVQGDADVNARGEHGNTALHHAVLVGAWKYFFQHLYFILCIFFLFLWCEKILVC